MIMNQESFFRQPTIKLLIIEVPAKEAQSIKKILLQESDPSFEVEIIQNHKLGFEQSLKGGVDVVLLDGFTSESQGIAMLEDWVSKAPWVARVALIDKAEKEFISEIKRKGVHDYLIKSEINAALLKRVIQYAMERRDADENMKMLANRGLDFVSLVSHELRAPLAIVKEGVNLVVDKILGKTNQKQHQVLTTARRNIDRLDHILTNMLDISKIDAEKFALKKTVV